MQILKLKTTLFSNSYDNVENVENTVLIVTESIFVYPLSFPEIRKTTKTNTYNISDSFESSSFGTLQI